MTSKKSLLSRIRTLFGRKQRSAGRKPTLEEMLAAQKPLPCETVRLCVDAEVIAGADLFSIIEPLWWTVDIYGPFADYEASLLRYSRGQRLLHAVRWYMIEVNNGGHDQFYFNSTGIVWKDALDGLIQIGAGGIADVLRESASRLGGEPPVDRRRRQELLEALKPNFEDLDEAFYTAQHSEDLDHLMLDYARRHPTEFFFSGTVTRPIQK